MRVLIRTAYAASRKEPLVDVLNRVRQAFLDSGLGEPVIQFNFSDHRVPSFVSSVDRVLKRHPELARFVTAAPPVPVVAGQRRITNAASSPAAGESIPYETVREIAAGVPRSFPFQSVALHLSAAVFGAYKPPLPNAAETTAGITITDSWWVNGRQRSLSSTTVVDADPADKKLPAPAPAVAAVLAACGKARNVHQAALPESSGAAEAQPVPAQASMAARLAAMYPAAQAVQPVVADYRARMGEIVERAALPHQLPPLQEALRPASGITAGPRKPALVRVFGPMGYSCKGGSGTFSLRRRSAANLTVELSLDVGTWSHLVAAIFLVSGVGFRAPLPLPVAAGLAPGAQYPIGDAQQWEKIVENLAALVKELEATFLPDIERAAGPSPAWYRPQN